MSGEPRAFKPVITDSKILIALSELHEGMKNIIFSDKNR